METIRRTKIVDLLKREDFGAMVNVKGWVRTRRGSKQVNFIALNDGSTINNVQIVVDLANFDEELLKLITTGACLSVNGELVKSVGSGQAAEIQAREIEVLGTCDNTYPLQKKGHSMEFLREIAHLRPRTNTFGAVFRIRHNMAIAIHKFFHERGFFYFHTPLITASDCEGAGQMFQVTTMNLYDLKKDENGSIIYDNDFFGKQASLTVSGQLEGELAATALGAIYTFGPTFRAENSNTPRHLAEFWMIEPEVAFNDINDTMDELTGILKGADDYITKPFNPPILLARIGVVLKRTTDKNAEKSRGNALNMEYKGVILNVVGGCIEHEGKKTDLTKNELKILHLLYQKKGEIVPRLDMIEYLWDNEVFIDDNTLSVNVTRLRGKLADIGVTDFIETKRGMGYRI